MRKVSSVNQSGNQPPVFFVTIVFKTTATPNPISMGLDTPKIAEEILQDLID